MGSLAIKREEPFYIDVKWESDVIELRGDLVNSHDTHESIDKIFSAIKSRPNWCIDASHARVFPNAISMWIVLVEECLKDCNLTYAPSQLTEILRYEDTYRDPHSTLEQY